MDDEVRMLKETIRYQEQVIEYQKTLIAMKDDLIKANCAFAARIMSERDQLNKELRVVKVELSDLKAGL